MDEYLQRALERALADFPGKYSLYCVELDTMTPAAAIAPQTRVVSASTIKVAIMLCALEEVNQGRLTLDRPVPLTQEDFCGDTRVFEPGYRKDSHSLWELLYWMIAVSDNSATNALITLLGYDRVNGWCEGLGLEHTSLGRKMLDFEAVARGRNNYTSALDQFRMYQALYEGRILNESLRKVAWDLLGRSRSFGSLLRYIPDPVTVCHKPGGLAHLSHDAGVFLLPGKPYYLGIFTWDGPSLDGEQEQARCIGRLSRLVYDHMKEKCKP